MDKALREHTRTMELKLEEWQKDLKSADGDERQTIRRDIRRTYRYHLAKVHDFQHERLIHLIIMLFFGLLFIFSIVASCVTEAFILTPAAVLTSILAILLLIVELFYIRHYYLLENGVQHLYTITDRMVVLIGD